MDRGPPGQERRVRGPRPLIVARLQLHRVHGSGRGRVGVRPARRRVLARGGAAVRKPQPPPAVQGQPPARSSGPAARGPGGAVAASVLPAPRGRRKEPRASRKRGRSCGSAAGGERRRRGRSLGGSWRKGEEGTVRKPRTPPSVCTPRSVSCYGWLKEPAGSQRGGGPGGVEESGRA